MRVCAASLAAVLAFGAAGAASAQGRLYTAYNIWYESPSVYSTNYQKGALLPAGSEVKDVDRASRNLEFTDVKTGTRFKAEFVSKHHPGVTRDQWIDRFLTTKNFGALTSGLTPAEITAIRAGRVQTGMSKKAVIVSAGYPPETGTAKTDLDVWRYWRNRFAYYSVQFAGGKVTNSAQ